MKRRIGVFTHLQHKATRKRYEFLKKKNCRRTVRTAEKFLRNPCGFPVALSCRWVYADSSFYSLLASVSLKKRDHTEAGPVCQKLRWSLIVKAPGVTAVLFIVE